MINFDSLPGDGDAKQKAYREALELLLDYHIVDDDESADDEKDTDDEDVGNDDLNLEASKIKAQEGKQKDQEDDKKQDQDRRTRGCGRPGCCGSLSSHGRCF